MKVKKAVIPAAGLGTRFLPITKAQPKEMLPIVDKPAIQMVVEEAVQSGIENLLIITGRHKRAIEDHFDRTPELESLLQAKNKTELADQMRKISEMAKIHYLRQTEPLGLGHAILSAKQFVGNEPFAVLLPDELICHVEPGIRQLISRFEQYRTSIIGVQKVPWEDLHQYGVVSGPEISPGTYQSTAIVEKPTKRPPSNLAIIGRYILEPEIFQHLERTSPGVGGEIQLSDALAERCAQNGVIAAEVKGTRYDIGNKFSFLRANIDFALEREDIGVQLRNYVLSLTRRWPSCPK